MEDLGQRASYLVIEDGMPVYSSDGEKLGEVEHLLADHEEDIFDGIVIDTSVLPGGHRFVDAEQVEDVYERGVVVKADRAAAEDYPQPSESPAAMEVDAEALAEGTGSELEQKLKRAWELISGKR